MLLSAPWRWSDNSVKTRINYVKNCIRKLYMIVHLLVLQELLMYDNELISLAWLTLFKHVILYDVHYSTHKSVRRLFIAAKVMNRARLVCCYSIHGGYETFVHLLEWHHIALISGSKQEDGLRIRVEDLILLLQEEYNVLHPLIKG
jgi:hypothetical protein